MTKADKPVVRQSYATHRGRPIVVTVHSTWLEFRILKTRKVFTMDIEAAYQRACLTEAENVRREKKAEKAAQKKVVRKR